MQGRVRFHHRKKGGLPTSPRKVEGSGELERLEEGALEYNDPPTIAWLRVRDVINLLWIDNPKLHDLGNVIESIRQHGFQELPKFDGNLPNIAGGQGAIKAGNGRLEALFQMEEDAAQAAQAGKDEPPLPRGLAREADTGAWAVPVLVGTDAPSRERAIAYAIDSNNLTMMGGSFDVADIARMWDEQAYLAVLTSLAAQDALPVSLDADDLDSLLAIADDLSAPEPGSGGTSDDWHQCPSCGFKWAKG